MSEQYQRRKWDGSSYGHDPAVDRLATYPSEPLSHLCGDAAPSIVVLGQVKKMGAAFLKSYQGENEKMKHDPALTAILVEPWSNNACQGYAMYAMENCGFPPEDIRRVVRELYYVSSLKSLDETRRHYENGSY